MRIAMLDQNKVHLQAAILSSTGARMPLEVHKLYGVIPPHLIVPGTQHLKVTSSAHTFHLVSMANIQ